MDHSGMNMDAGHDMGTTAWQMLDTGLSIELIGLLIGILSIVPIFITARRLGGHMQKGLTYLGAGLVFMTLSFGLSLAFTYLGRMDATTMMIHNTAMVAGMILFVVSARKFSKLMRH